MTDRLRKLRQGLETMEEYLHMRISLRDWHGVMDAAADIREIEAQIKLLSELPPGFDG